MPESVGFLQLSLMAIWSLAVVNTHCSSQQYKSQICSPELPEPHWLGGKGSGLQCIRLRFESIPELQIFYFSRVSFPGKK